MSQDVNNHSEVIIIGSGATALAIVHCLAKIGMRPKVVSHGGSDIATYSRFCDTLSSPVSIHNGEEFLSWLLGCLEGDKRCFLIPESDSARLFLAEYRGRLSESVYSWGGSFDDMRDLIEKDRLYKKAEDNGIPVPQCFKGDTVSELSEWLDDVPGPYFAKPFYSADPNHL